MENEATALRDAEVQSVTKAVSDKAEVGVE